MKNLRELLKRTSKEFAKSEKDFYKSYDIIKNLTEYSDLVKLNGAEKLKNRYKDLSFKPRANKLILERIIGKNHLMDINYFSKGLKVARTVGRVVEIRSEYIKGIGTGFLIAPNILMTNNHVIRNEYDVEEFMVEFEYEKNEKGDIGETAFFKFNPSAFFITNEDLDYTVIAVEPISQNNPKKELKDYGYNKLSSSKHNVIRGEHMSIIQHPKGLPKKIAFRENIVVEIKDSIIHYTTDTERGSSGSLVVNDQWEIIALHIGGVAKTNKKGDLLTKKGKIISDNSDDELIHWIANQGVLIKDILRDISREKLPEEAKVYQEEILEDYKASVVEYRLPEKRDVSNDPIQ